MYAIKQLSVFLENSHGKLAFFTKKLSESKISLKSITIAESADFGLARVIVNNPLLAKEALEANGISVHLTDVFGVKIKDNIGSFNKIVEILSEKNIDIVYCYSFYESQSGIFIFNVKPKFFQEAIDTMLENKIELVEAKYFYE